MTRICVVWAFYTVSVLGLVQAFIASSNSNRWISTKPPRAFSVLQLSASDAIADEIQGWDPSFYEIFMERYWQKKPVLIRQAFPQVMETLQLSPLDVYLAKLASDDDVETRTFRNRRGKWEKTYGPYEEREIVHCPKSNWSLLLQEVDRHVPRVADLWDRGFGFIPSWRRDDVMMSYSMPGGSIGAHVDNYDVFLIQGSGSRQWSIEHNFLSEVEEKKREVPNVATRLLRNFRADQSWILKEGDMLYLPPRLPHQGTTVGEEACVTISMGFRAPDYKTLVTALWDHICQTRLQENNSLFADGAFAAQYLHSRGEVCVAARDEFKTGISSKISDYVDSNEDFNIWLGKYLTSPLRYHMRKPRPFFLENELDVYEKEQGRVTLEEEDEVEDEDDEESDENEDDGKLPMYLRDEFGVASKRVFESANDIVQSLNLEPGMTLRKCEGVRITFIEDTLFVNGEEIPTKRDIAQVLSSSIVVDGQKIRTLLQTDDDKSLRSLLIELLEQGYFYPVEQ